MIKRIRSIATVAMSFGALLAFSPGAVRAEVLSVSGDTEIKSGSPTSNFGSAAPITVNATSSVLLGFDLSTVPAGTVSRAKLTIFVNNTTASGTFYVGACNVWGTEAAFAAIESSITYSGNPD